MQECTGCADSLTVPPDVHVDVTNARLHRPVHIINERHAQLAARLQERSRGGMRIARAAHLNGTAGSAPLVSSTLPVLLRLEHRKNVVESPACRPILCPAVKVALHAATPYQPVDTRAASEHVAEGHIQAAVVEVWTWLDRKVVVERAAQVIEPNARGEGP